MFYVISVLVNLRSLCYPHIRCLLPWLFQQKPLLRRVYVNLLRLLLTLHQLHRLLLILILYLLLLRLLHALLHLLYPLSSFCDQLFRLPCRWVVLLLRLLFQLNLEDRSVRFPSSQRDVANVILPTLVLQSTDVQTITFSFHSLGAECTVDNDCVESDYTHCLSLLQPFVTSVHYLDADVTDLAQSRVITVEHDLTDHNYFSTINSSQVVLLPPNFTLPPLFHNFGFSPCLLQPNALTVITSSVVAQFDVRSIPAHLLYPLAQLFQRKLVQLFLRDNVLWVSFDILPGLCLAFLWVYNSFHRS